MSGTIHLINKSRKKNSITNTSFYHSPLLPKKHNHVEMKIGNFKLIYNDPRRFCYFSYFKSDEQINNNFKKYGPEPFDSLFNKVYDKYDLMNDFMSFGIHRLWKKTL